MARRVISTNRIVGWPAVGLGVVILVFGVVIMAVNGTPIWIILGWGALGLFITGALAASELGYGPRFERR